MAAEKKDEMQFDSRTTEIFEREATLSAAISLSTSQWSELAP